MDRNEGSFLRPAGIAHSLNSRNCFARACSVAAYCRAEQCANLFRPTQEEPEAKRGPSGLSPACQWGPRTHEALANPSDLTPLNRSTITVFVAPGREEV
jgi:hypothetical protein